MPPPNLPPEKFGAFDETNPFVRIEILAFRIDALCKEKEELERREAAFEQRIAKMENLLSQERLDKMDAATQFMSNAEFMGKWTWRAVYGFIILSGGFFAAFKFWKGQP